MIILAQSLLHSARLRVDVEPSLSDETRQRHSESLSHLDGEAGRSPNGCYERQARSQCLLHDFERSSAAHHYDPAIQRKLAVEKRSPDDFVHGVVTPNVFSQRFKRAVGLKKRCCMKPSRPVEYRLALAESIGERYEHLGFYNELSFASTLDIDLRERASSLDFDCFQRSLPTDPTAGGHVEVPVDQPRIERRSFLEADGNDVELRGARIATIGDLLDMIGSRHETLGKEESRGEFEVIPWGSHRDRDAAGYPLICLPPPHPYFQRFLYSHQIPSAGNRSLAEARNRSPHRARTGSDHLISRFMTRSVGGACTNTRSRRELESNLRRLRVARRGEDSLFGLLWPRGAWKREGDLEHGEGTAMAKATGGKLFDPANWASWKPFGMGEQRPNNYLEIAKAIGENRDQLAYAWRILSQGTCDGCSLGTMGLHDWTLDEIHLCNIRLRLLRLNTMPALDPTALLHVESLRGKSGAELREFGRLPYPMIRRRGESGFARVTWDQALGEISERIRATVPERLGFYLTSRGQPNETYFAAQKAVRAMGTNSIDNAARVCHSPSTFGLKGSLGVAATTCSYSDWIGSDLVVFVGSNVANNQPVSMKYLYKAKKAGTKVVVINSYREPGMERYWVPSNVESAVFGTKIADRFFVINVGGDIGFLNGTLKAMIAEGLLDQDFIDRHVSGFEELVSCLEGQSWAELEASAGVPRREMEEFARMLGKAATAVFVWSMGITQHEFGEDNVRAIVNLALTKGFVGRDKCGVMPIRGHSGVQGGAEMGAYSTVLPGGLPLTEENAETFTQLWGFKVSPTKGLTAPEMIDAGHDGRLDVFFSSGGNFLEVLPEPDYCKIALERIPLRVHLDIVLSSQMLVDPDDTVVLLPAATRYEMPGGVTQTTTERRVIFSPEVPGRRIGEARPEWEIFCDLAKRVAPSRAESVHFEDTAAIRSEIASVIPIYDGIQRLAKFGDQFQYGGPHLCADWEFPTPDGRARFSVVELPEFELPEGHFMVATRRGKQFNSLVHGRIDPLTGAEREAVLINPRDAVDLGLYDGDPVLLRSGVGEFLGSARIAPVQLRTLQVHWPEGQVLIDRRARSPQGGVPDYNAAVTLEKVGIDVTTVR